MNPLYHCRIGAVPAAVALALLAGCGHPLGDTSAREGVPPQTMAACRHRADEVFDRQNRADVYRSDMFSGGERDAPFAGSTLAGSPTAGLSARYARETLLDDCLNGIANRAGGTPDAPEPQVTPAAAASPAATVPSGAVPSGAVPVGQPLSVPPTLARP
jgi:hypothetical protein